MATQADVDRQYSLLATYRRNIEHYLASKAELGDLTPPGILNGIESTRRYIAQIKQNILSMSGIPVNDLAGIDYDIPHTVTLNIDIEVYRRIRQIADYYGIELPEV